MNPVYGMIFIFIIACSGISGTAGAQFEKESDENILPPVSVKIILPKEPVKIGVETVLKIKFSAQSGYHINLIPPFKISAEIPGCNAKLSAKPVFDEEKLKEAERLIAKGEAVYLDTSKEYSFKFLVEGELEPGARDIKWKIEVFYCSEKDGLCYRKEIKSKGMFNIKI